MLYIANWYLWSTGIKINHFQYVFSHVYYQRLIAEVGELKSKLTAAESLRLDDDSDDTDDDVDVDDDDYEKVDDLSEKANSSELINDGVNPVKVSKNN